MIIKVAGKEVNLAKCLPLTFGDLEKLEELGVKDLNNMSRKELTAYVHYVVTKGNPEITLEDVRTLPVLAMQKINKLSEKADADFLDSFISSESYTGGLN